MIHDIYTLIYTHFYMRIQVHIHRYTNIFIHIGKQTLNTKKHVMLISSLINISFRHY